VERIGLSWARREGRDCLRVDGAPAGAALNVWPAAVCERAGLPPMAGSWVGEDESRCFVPRFSFVDGESYVVGVDDLRLTPIARAASQREAAAAVAAILPSAPVVPRNVLRFYVWFTAPMSEGTAASCVTLLDEDGFELPAAIMPSDYELWDPDRRRLTVLMDPARIKRGLVSNRTLGYPLVPGRRVRLAVDQGFLDARGGPLLAGRERSYVVGQEERRLVDPGRWRLDSPCAGTTDPVRIDFDRPLDHALIPRCLRVTDASGVTVTGRASVGEAETGWAFEPDRAWSAGPYEVAVDSILEDLAGNSIERIFDRDLEHDPTGSRGAVILPFRPRD
jgi:hypothetical protein